MIVGAPLFGEEAYGRRLRELSARLGLDDRVEFTGFREDVVGELERFDVLVHASVIPEPFGQVVTEGLAAGLPVLAAAAGGPAEIIENGKTGILYPPGDADALAEGLVRLARDAELRRRLGDAAREKARDFDPELIASEVMRVYEQVLAARPARGRRAARLLTARGE